MSRQARTAPGPAEPRRFVVVQPRGVWHGRPVAWDPDRQAIEQERQRWVYESISGTNELITELTVDPGREYARHIAAYIESGSELELRLALEYVRCPA